MERRDRFGSIEEITLESGLIKTNAKPECRNCEQVRDCLRYGKQMAEEKREKDEPKRSISFRERPCHRSLQPGQQGFINPRPQRNLFSSGSF